MKSKLFELKESTIYRMFFTILLAIGGLLVANDMEMGLVVSWQAVCFMAGVVLLLACLNYLQLRGKVISSLVAAGCLFLGIRSIPEGKLWENQYIRLLIFVTIIYLAEILLEKLLFLKAALAVGILIYLVTGLFGRYTISHVGAIILMWTIVLYIVEVVEHFWKKSKEHPRTSYMMWIMPFCVIYLIFALLTPAPEKPYDWQFVKDAYTKISQMVTIWLEDLGRGGQEDFGRAVSGFSEDGKLMSSLVTDAQELLVVQGTRGLKTNVYLMGKVYDTFLGNGWTYQHSDLYHERFVDTMESVYYLNGFDSEFQEDYFSGTKLTVEYLYFNTGFLFAPLKTWLVEDVEYTFDGPDLRFNEQVGYSTRYRTSYYQLNINHPSFYSFVHSSKEESEERWNQVAREYTPRGEKRVTYEELLQRRNDIYEYYLPETAVSAEVRAYLDDILEGADTNVEKLIAIEEALQQIEYTLTPGVIPDTVEDAESFLDYFLLENKKGYCAYFATAFVLLARAEGIPARYVEGFSVPIDSDKNVVVYSDMAHAWPEVYLEGVGWIPFEPTPGYAEIRYTPWEPESEAAKNITGVDLNVWEDEEEDSSLAPEDAPNTGEKDLEKTVDWENVLFAVLTIISIIGCVVLFLWLERLWRKKRFERMNLTQRFEQTAMNNMWLLRKLGMVRLQEETLEELQVKSGTQYQFIVLLEELRYGEKEIVEYHIQIAQMEQEQILDLLKAKNIWLYYLAKIRL